MAKEVKNANWLLILIICKNMLKFSKNMAIFSTIVLAKLLFLLKGIEATKRYRNKLWKYLLRKHNDKNDFLLNTKRKQ